MDISGAPNGQGSALTGPLVNSRVNGTHVHLEARLGQGSTAVTVIFDGTLNAAGNAISGTWSETLGSSGSVSLQRGAAVQP
jgi:hypothetical protein